MAREVQCNSRDYIEKNSNKRIVLLQKEVTTVIRKIDTAPTYTQISNKNSEANVKSCELWMETDQWAIWCLTFGSSCDNSGCSFSCIVPVAPKQEELKAA